MKVNPSMENYLETILILSRREPLVRSIDIANELSYSKPSVSVATKKLKNLGYINLNEQGEITLTEKGKAVATTVYERHTILSKFLIAIGVEEEAAKEDACRIEHIISKESFEAIKKYYKKYIS